MKLAYPAMIGTILICIIFSCNKKKDPPVKSVEELVKGKAWSGDIKYTADWTDQPFYLKFNGIDNTFSWVELRGLFPGTYNIDETKRQVKLSFASGNTIIAAIDNNGKVSDISYGGTYNWTLQNVEPNTSGGNALDNTNWKGPEAYKTIPPNPDFTLAFKPGSIVSIGSATGVSYTRDGATIRASLIISPFTLNFFMVVNQNKIKGIKVYGSDVAPVSRFELLKQ